MTFMKAALLIEASDVKGQLPIPGAKKDVENWDTYLRSNAGGVWTEINTWHKPAKKDVLSHLKYLGLFHEYVFVAFSGHGYHDAQKDRTVVLLNDSEEMEVTEFQPFVRSTVVVDACRGIETTQVYRAEQARITALSAINESLKKASFSQQTARDYETLFEKTVMQENGAGILYSCNTGEAAEEDPNTGGVYTTALIGTGRTWHDGNQSLVPSVLTTSQAHSAAKALLALKRFDQQPQCRFSGTGSRFPFAVRP